MTTIAATQLSLMRGQTGFMQAQGFELHAIASPDPDLGRLAERDGIEVHPVAISRSIAPIQDLLAIFQLCREFRRIRPHIAHYSTPKAALLGSIAAWLCNVPVRIFVFRGSLTETARGKKRWLFRGLERLTAQLSHEVVCVAPSLLAFARAEGILPSTRGIVVANGMSNGIDVSRFDPAHPPAEDADALRPLHAWQTEAPAAPVIGFVGRLVRDKGIEDLAAAWRQVKARRPDARLLIIGPWEAGDRVDPGVRSALEGDSEVFFAGPVSDVVPYYRLMTIFCFPSHREGFPNAPMEAAAMRLPVIATNAVGCVDAVVDGVTGAIVPIGAPAELAEAVLAYLDDPDLARRHGEAGRERVLNEFQPTRIWQGLLELYQRRLMQAGGR